MVAPVYRPSGVLAGTFGVGILTFLLLPSEVGYQDLAALIARDVASVERPTENQSCLALRHDPRGKSQSAAAGRFEHQADVAGLYARCARSEQCRDHWIDSRADLAGKLVDCLRPAPPVLRVDRSRKSDQLTAVPRKSDNVAAKGDRLAVPPVQQAEAAPNVEEPSQQVAVAPPVGAMVEVATPADIEAEHVVAAEKQLADAAEMAAKMQMAERLAREMRTSPLKARSRPNGSRARQFGRPARASPIRSPLSVLPRRRSRHGRRSSVPSASRGRNAKRSAGTIGSRARPGRRPRSWLALGMPRSRQQSWLALRFLRIPNRSNTRRRLQSSIRP